MPSQVGAALLGVLGVLAGVGDVRAVRHGGLLGEPTHRGDQESPRRARRVATGGDPVDHGLTRQCSRAPALPAPRWPCS